MIPRIHLGTAPVPDGPSLELYSHGDDFMIVIGQNELMNSRMSGSEEALAEMALDRLAHAKAPHLLIGGYGMGFTLRAALARMGPQGRVTLAELVPGILEWARGPMKDLAAGCLDDPRVNVVVDDVSQVIARATKLYDAILLDVDNGPDGLVREGNSALYSKAGLAAARRALRPGGVLAIWSAASDDAFRRRLVSAGWQVDEVVVRARKGGKGPRHVIWFAT